MRVVKIIAIGKERKMVNKKNVIYGGERLPKTEEEWYAYWNIIPNFDTKKGRTEYIKRKIREMKNAE